MILRRVIAHFRKQEWTAIAIDFVIVVMGVFIGTNVTNWNEARKSTERAAAYSERLLGDLRAEYEYALALRQYDVDVLSAGEAAYDGLAGRRDLDDRAILIGAFRATQFNWYERRRAAFDELMATSSLDLITDPKLREVAIVIYNTPLFAAMQSAGQNDTYRDLMSETLEPSVRQALRDNCGDRLYGAKNGAVGLLEIGYACDLPLSDAEVKAAVDALRANEPLHRAMKAKLARVSGWIYDIDLTLKAAGIAPLFADEDAK